MINDPQNDPATPEQVEQLIAAYKASPPPDEDISREVAIKLAWKQARRVDWSSPRRYEFWQ